MKQINRMSLIVLRLALITLIAIALAGCSQLSWDSTGAGKIVPPQNTICPLEGRWIVVDDFTVERPYSPIQGSKEDYLGMMIQFAKDAVELRESLWQSPNYKVKHVNMAEYMLSKYLELPEEIIPESDQVSVITVASAESFIGEFLKLGEDAVIALMQNRVLYLQKTTENISLDGGEYKASPDRESPEKDYMNAAGVLLALKTPMDAHDPLQGYNYRTLWIAAEKGALHPILESPDIFFPRLSGFWEIKKIRINEQNKVEERLLAYDLSTKRPEGNTGLALASNPGTKKIAINDTESPQASELPALKPNPLFWQDKQGSLVREIVYLGTDYLSVEISGQGTYLDSATRQWSTSRYMTLPLDNITASKGIKVSDLLGDKGFAAWQNAYNQIAGELEEQGYTLPETGEEEENFGLVREIGRWFLQGRAAFFNGNTLQYRDFGFNFIPPSKLVSYDILYVPWPSIKERVPEAIDAYTSPNQDFAIVLTKSKLMVFQIEQNQLHGNPLAEVVLEDGEGVIMAEWATGLYVDDWEKSFKRYKAPKALTEIVEK